MCVLLTSIMYICVYIIHVHVEYGMIVLWYMLYDWFTYFSQRVGVTTTLPDWVPYNLLQYGVGPNEWTYSGQSLIHDVSHTNFPHLPPLHQLSTHQTVGLLISTSSHLHVYIDGCHSECIASGLSVNKPLFGAVDVCGKCTKIKSEFLSGEFGIEHWFAWYTSAFVHTPNCCKPVYYV